MIASNTLVGERLELRPMRIEDVERFAEWTMDPEVIFPVTGGRLFTHEEEIAWFRDEEKSPERLQYTIVLRDSRKIIGSCGIMGLSTLAEKGVELGIMIGDKTEWGKGYAAEVLGLLLKYAREDMLAPRVFLKVDKNHDRAQRAYRKAGFDIIDTIETTDHPHGGGASHIMEWKNPDA